MAQVKCLTCKYAPEWSLPAGGDIPYCTGNCRKEVNVDGIPATWLVQQRSAMVCSDGSGFPMSCTAFENKS